MARPPAALARLACPDAGYYSECPDRSGQDSPRTRPTISSPCSISISANVESLKTYIQDAQAEGDEELGELFSAGLENHLEAAQEMLVTRFQSE
jgi:hypothetical protein